MSSGAWGPLRVLQPIPEDAETMDADQSRAECAFFSFMNERIERFQVTRRDEVTGSPTLSITGFLAGVLLKRRVGVSQPEAPEKGADMTAYLVFSEREPLLIVCSNAAISDGRFTDRLDRLGLQRCIVHRVPLDRLRQRYGVPFEVIEEQIHRGKAVRVLDYDGHSVFSHVDFDDLGPGIVRSRGAENRIQLS